MAVVPADPIDRRLDVAVVDVAVVDVAVVVVVAEAQHHCRMDLHRERCRGIDGKLHERRQFFYALKVNTKNSSKKYIRSCESVQNVHMLLLLLLLQLLQWLISKREKTNIRLNTSMIIIWVQMEYLLCILYRWH